MLFLSTYPNPLRNHSSSVKKHHSFLKCNETYFVLSELLLVKLTLHMFAMHSHMIRSVKDKKVLLRTPNNPLQTNFWRPSVREGSKAPQPPRLTSTDTYTSKTKIYKYRTMVCLYVSKKGPSSTKIQGSLFVPKKT